MKHPFTDQEELPILGGPHDGGTHHVSVIFPWIDGGVPSSLVVIEGQAYELDCEARAWRHVGVFKQGTE